VDWKRAEGKSVTSYLTHSSTLNLNYKPLRKEQFETKEHEIL